MFDFKISLGARFQTRKADTSHKLPAPYRYWVFYFVSRASCPRFEGETPSTRDLLSQWNFLEQMLGQDDQVLDIDDTVAPGHRADIT